MKKILFIFAFIFLFGLFAGLFFSAGLSSENNSYLSSLLISGFYSSTPGFVKVFFSAFAANLLLVIIMLPAVLHKLLSPLPAVILWYKSFSTGFCSGLLYLNAGDKAFYISALRILPQNLFIIPAFIVISAVLFSFSVSYMIKKSRPNQERKSLLYLLCICMGAIIAGCLTEAVFHLIAL